MSALIDSIVHAVSLTSPAASKVNIEGSPKSSNRIFLVHGHDKEMLKSVEAYMRRLGLEPIVLGDKANEGLTLIEKFLKHSDVGYAVILLSPDDVGAEKGVTTEALRRRPRQNAVLELGYFVGRLGRSCVAAVTDATVTDVDYPSDVSGIVSIPFHASHNEWQLLLLRELTAANIPVDRSQI
jgi:predicted nucleotide-binding protein